MVLGHLAFCLTAASALDPSKITQSENYRLVTDTEKSTWNAKQASGVCALLSASNTFSIINPLITPAESWIGPSSTSGIYFKGGNVGIGTTEPIYKLVVSNAGADGFEFAPGLNMVGTPTANTVLFQAYNRSTSKFSNIDLSAGSYRFGIAGSEHVRIDNLGNVGIGTMNPTSRLHLAAGTATASTAPLKLTPTGAVLLTTPELGAIECNTTNLYYTRVSDREIIPTVITKTDTGDPTGAEGILSINTFDNNVKIFADGAWRTLATW